MFERMTAVLACAVLAMSGTPDVHAAGIDGPRDTAAASGAPAIAQPTSGEFTIGWHRLDEGDAPAAGRISAAAHAILHDLHAPDVVVVAGADAATLAAIATRTDAGARMLGRDARRYVARAAGDASLRTGFLLATREVAPGTPRVQLQASARDRSHGLPMIDVVARTHEGGRFATTIAAAPATGRRDADATASYVARAGARATVDIGRAILSLDAGESTAGLVVIGDGILAIAPNRSGAAPERPQADFLVAVTGPGINVAGPHPHPHDAPMALVNLAVRDADEVSGLAFDRASPDGAERGSAHARPDVGLLRIRLGSPFVADLAVDVVADQPYAQAGTFMSWSTRVDNLGPDGAESTTVRLVLDAWVGMAFVTGNRFGCTGPSHPTPTTTLFTCTSGLLAPGTGTLTVTARAPESAHGGTVTLTAEAASQTLDPDPANDVDSASIAVEAVADLAIDVSGGPGYFPGSAVPVFVDFRNLGPSLPLGATLAIESDLPRANASLVGYPTAFWSCTQRSTRFFALDCHAIADLPVGMQMVFPLRVSTTARPNLPSFTVRARMGSVSQDPDPANDVDSVRATLRRPTP